ncbi:MAG: Appr-p processing protein [Oscillospiraceae bacterium]|nr:Appr-p processing protein [Oscillospiraceae bacterium]
MIQYTTGDLLLSSTQALVNTVNCEGYMGKGIAYQFKLKFPENNADYIKACKVGSLRIGTIHYYQEKDKIIINFPTKNKWREKSKMEYIESGLNSLILVIEELKIQSISIPPLGSGNGGLVWSDVKALIEKILSPIASSIDILIYEPSKGYVSQPTVEPQLSTSALVLMQIKRNLKNFSKIRLQKSAYFIDVFLNEKYFKFKRHKLGPYDYNIEIISKNIKEFQKFHSIKNTDDAYTILYNKIVSDSVEKKLSIIKPALKKACAFIDSLPTDGEVECCATITFLLEENGPLNEDVIVSLFKAWSKDKSERFSEQMILNGISTLYEANIIDKNLLGYTLVTN